DRWRNSSVNVSIPMRALEPLLNNDSIYLFLKMLLTYFIKPPIFRSSLFTYEVFYSVQKCAYQSTLLLEFTIGCPNQRLPAFDALQLTKTLIEFQCEVTIFV